jgi:hypothetical protein
MKDNFECKENVLLLHRPLSRESWNCMSCLRWFHALSSFYILNEKIFIKVYIKDRFLFGCLDEWMSGVEFSFDLLNIFTKRM